MGVGVGPGGADRALRLQPERPSRGGRCRNIGYATIESTVVAERAGVGWRPPPSLNALESIRGLESAAPGPGDGHQIISFSAAVRMEFDGRLALFNVGGHDQSLWQ